MKIHNLENELKSKYSPTVNPTGDVKKEEKILSPPITDHVGCGEVEDKKDMSSKEKKTKSKKSSKKTKKTEAKLDCEHCPLFKLYELDKFVDGESATKSP